MTVYNAKPLLQIDWRNALTKGLVGCWVTEGVDEVRNLVTGEAGSFVGSTWSKGSDPDQYTANQTTNSTTAGTAIDVGTGDVGGVNFDAVSGQAWSVITKFLYNAATATGAICALASAATGATLYVRKSSATGNFPTIRIKGTDTTPAFWTGTAGSGDVPHTIGITWDGTTCNAYGDDALGPTALTAGGTAKQTENFSMLARTPSSPGFTAYGQHYFTFVFNRAISEAEFRSLNEDPYQIFLDGYGDWLYGFIATLSGGGVTVTRDTVLAFDHTLGVQNDSALAFDHHIHVNSDSTLEYNWGGTLTRDMVLEYDHTLSVSRDQALEYDHVANVYHDMAIPYDHGWTVQADSTIHYDHAGAVSVDYVLSYDHQVTVTTDAALAYDHGIKVIADYALPYGHWGTVYFYDGAETYLLDITLSVWELSDTPTQWLLPDTTSVWELPITKSIWEID